MLRTAEESVARAGLAGRIILKHALAETLAPDLFGLERPFDHAIFSYSLSMIPDWRAALRQAAQIVGTDGFIHVVDFGDLKSLWPFAERGLRAWLSLFHVSPRDELLRLLESGTRTRQNCTLRTWPGRYAFVLKASPSAINHLAD
jgi:S-adenosylmethionine-diacylgycerolhomoserine-N-methlytransferase